MMNFITRNLKFLAGLVIGAFALFAGLTQTTADDEYVAKAASFAGVLSEDGGYILLPVKVTNSPDEEAVKE